MRDWFLIIRKTIVYCISHLQIDALFSWLRCCKCAIYFGLTLLPCCLIHVYLQGYNENINNLYFLFLCSVMKCAMTEYTKVYTQKVQKDSKYKLISHFCWETSFSSFWSSVGLFKYLIWGLNSRLHFVLSCDK